MAERVVVAGGGASGLVAAIFAAQNGARVTILEHKDRVGKKILMTGNGRCNLTNMSDVRGKYYSSGADSLDRIYDTLVRFDAARTRDFFESLGLYTKEKRDGGVYPASEQASIVLDVLRSACDRLGVQIRTDCDVTAVKPGRSGGVVSVVQCERAEQGQDRRDRKCPNKAFDRSHREELAYDRLILATGGRAASVSGSDGSGYELARRLGHSVVEPLPALVQLRCDGAFFKALSGVRAQSEIRLLIDGREAAREQGELQLTDYGISGIPVFQFSRLVSRAVHDQKQCEARIDFIPYINIGKTDEKSIERFPHKTAEEFLSGLVHKKVAAVVCRQNRIAPGETVAQAGVG
ncbi:MAG: NAD(P)/FAD-dependent oxidoreductase, partial [Lachnospiraceae bacterium]|nr:NAD(P)/FAD-dependent oxidoreductase [Lachnospiraceae bacterium]